VPFKYVINMFFYIIIIDVGLVDKMNGPSRPFFFFFDMPTQEGRRRFELVTSALLGVVLAYKLPLGDPQALLYHQTITFFFFFFTCAANENESEEEEKRRLIIDRL
jgi:hypothetical protein